MSSELVYHCDECGCYMESDDRKRLLSVLGVFAERPEDLFTLNQYWNWRDVCAACAGRQLREVIAEIEASE